ncbi:hypothetical protein T4A_4592, partial [Trichinella pseudospiralis]
LYLLSVELYLSLIHRSMWLIFSVMDIMSPICLHLAKSCCKFCNINRHMTFEFQFTLSLSNSRCGYIFFTNFCFNILALIAFFFFPIFDIY